VPSAAATRWLITPLPSRPLSCHPPSSHPPSHLGNERPGLGHPCWRLHLWRQRNGPPGCWDITLQDQAWRQMPDPQASREPGSTIAMAANDDSLSHRADHSAAGR
jgi:hypothetical protein